MSVSDKETLVVSPHAFHTLFSALRLNHLSDEKRKEFYESAMKSGSRRGLLLLKGLDIKMEEV